VYNISRTLEHLSGKGGITNHFSNTTPHLYPSRACTSILGLLILFPAARLARRVDGPFRNEPFWCEGAYILLCGNGDVRRRMDYGTRKQSFVIRLAEMRGSGVVGDPTVGNTSTLDIARLCVVEKESVGQEKSANSTRLVRKRCQADLKECTKFLVTMGNHRPPALEKPIEPAPFDLQLSRHTKTRAKTPTIRQPSS